MLKAILNHSTLSFKASFLKFAQTAITIQDTSSNLTKHSIMQEYFENCNQHDQQQVIKILNFLRDKPKTGISTTTIISILREKYFPDFQSIGSDLDNVIDQLEDADHGDSSVEISAINDFLVALVSTSGNKSIIKKRELISDMLDHLNLVEAKIFLRILDKNLRIGMNEKSFKFKKQLQAQISQSDGKLQTVDSSKRKIKMPLIELMLAKPLKNISDVWKFCQNKDCKNLIADLKYDGERTLIIYKRGVGLELMSRRRKWQTQSYKPLVESLQAELQKILGLEDIQIDGQIMCVNNNGQHLPLQYLIAKRGKNADQESQNKVVVFGFDVIQINGKCVRDQNLLARRKLIPQTEHLLLGQYMKFTYPEQKQKLLDYFKKTLQKKLEGLIIKGQNDLYHINGTRKYWGKFKKGCKITQNDSSQIDLDLVVMGAFRGEGKRSQFFATYLVGVYHNKKLYPVCKVGSGFTDAQLEEYTSLFNQLIVDQKPEDYEIPRTLKIENYIKPTHVFKVVCQDLTRSPLYKLYFEEDSGGISLRFPVFQQIRQDKDPKSCTSESLLQYIQIDKSN